MASGFGHRGADDLRRIVFGYSWLKGTKYGRKTRKNLDLIQPTRAISRVPATGGGDGASSGSRAFCGPAGRIRRGSFLIRRGCSATRFPRLIATRFPRLIRY